MSSSTYKVITLAERPGLTGEVSDKTFRIEELPYADLKPGPKEVLYKTLYLSVDPTQRTWLNDVRGYMEPVKIGDPMRSGGIAVVVEAGEGSVLKPGDYVYGITNWRAYGVGKDVELQRLEVPPGAQLLDFLGVLGTTGLAAYFGIHDIGKLKAGETFVVSGAAGATGSVACQIGKKLGAKVIAIAGSQEKVDWLEKELGVDKAINYKSPTFKEEFIEAVGYLDVYFDNVGGDILNLALSRLNLRARIINCGAIASYNGNAKGLTNYSALISQRAKMEGFLVFDYRSQYHVAREVIGKWIAEDAIKTQFHIIEGIENCPKALQLLFSGANTGKFVVKVADPAPRATL
ncbi:alcohol dehydrogenase [Cytidiella melzeri]|nr:alcohol dehydrogenase [Cytidiella melzeri]